MNESVKSKAGRTVSEKAAPDRRAILARHCAGDSNAFPDLIRIFGSSIYSYVIRSGIELGSTDDVVQEIFMKIHSQAHLYQSDRPLEPWLFTIVANTVRSHFRKSKVRAILGVLPEEGVEGSERSAEENLQTKQTGLWLEQTIAGLSVPQREVINLCVVEGLAQKDVAGVLKMPLNTVKTHLSRARIELAKALSRRKAELLREVSS